MQNRCVAIAFSTLCDEPDRSARPCARDNHIELTASMPIVVYLVVYQGLLGLMWIRGTSFSVSGLARNKAVCAEHDKKMRWNGRLEFVSV